jgi:hypothetical protein
VNQTGDSSRWALRYREERTGNKCYLFLRRFDQFADFHDGIARQLTKARNIGRISGHRTLRLAKQIAWMQASHRRLRP